MFKHFFKSGKSPFIWQLFPVMMLILGACSKGSDEPNQEPTPGPTPTKLNFTLTIVSPEMESTLLASSTDGSQVDTKFYSHFNDGGTKRVLAKQNGKIVDLGSYDVTLLSTSGEEGRIEVDATDKLSADNPYDLYIIGGSYRWDNGDVYYRKAMSRKDIVATWLKLSSSSIPQKAKDNLAGTGEILFVINKSGAPIKFKHKGFDAANKWYYNYAEVLLDNGSVVKSEDGEAESDEKEIPVFTGENAEYFYSTYVPNGNLINDAQLIAEIDGKEVRSSNRISSNITIQTNHSYAMLAIWDGKKLMIGDDDSGNSVIELPADVSISFNDLSVICDGQIVDVSKDGIFKTDASSIIAFNGSNIVFLSYACEEEKHTLNASETAVSLLLPSIPLALSDLDNTHLWILKKMIGHLDETKLLADAINQSIKSYGFLNMEVIATPLNAALSELKKRFGITNSPSRSQPKRLVGKKEGGVPSYPYFSQTVSKQTYADGFTITMTSSSLEEAEGKKFWRCKFDLLNADRFCYTTITKGYKAENGLFGRLDKSFTDTFRNLIKPMNLSAFMDFGTLTDLATNPQDFLTALSDPDFDRVINQFWEPLKNLGHIIIGEPTETVTYDKIQVKDIDICFYSSNEHLLIAGPGIDDNLILFNIVRIGFQPVLKMIIGEIQKTDEYEKSKLTDKLFIEFVKWMASADLPFRAKLISTFTDSSLSWGEKTDIFLEVFQRFDKFFQEKALDFVSEAVFEEYMSSVYKGYKDPQIKAIFMTYKSVLTAGDLLQLVLDIGYKGCAFELIQGLEQYNGNLDDILGSDL